MVERYPECWREFLKEELVAPPLCHLYKKLLSIQYYPPRRDIFNVFNMNIEDIKLVVLGQDPYPHNAACGYSFAVAEGVKKPVSLRIMEKELGHELDPSLKDWIAKGVFLLNTALTVESGKPGSHIEYWAIFTRNLIHKISTENPCSWLLMGKYAQKYSAFIQNKDKNHIFEVPHPAAEVYSGGKAGFIGCNVFKQINEVLNLEL